MPVPPEPSNDDQQSWPTVAEPCAATDAITTAPEAGGPGATPPSLGRYVALVEIARGGMGAILRGHDPDLGRDLAIKTILPELLAGKSEAVRREVLKRFAAEAKINAQLQHPGIVPVFEVGKTAEGIPYFTMKLVSGQSLAALLDQRPNPAHELGRFLNIFEQICQALAYAHSRGVLHRDLKPQNVVVGAFGEVQVMDWGLAKILRAAPSTAGQAQDDADVDVVPTAAIFVAEQSGPGLATVGGWGTLQYMPPEQARAELDRLGPPSDVFGLGGILCKILTGLPPYTGRDVGELSKKAVHADLTDASARLDSCGADKELVQLAKECLAADLGRRPPHAGAVAERMTAYAVGVQERLKAAEVAKAVLEEREKEFKRTVARNLARLRSRWPDEGTTPGTM